ILERGPRVFARPRFERAGDDIRLARQRPLPGTLGLGELEVDPEAAQFLDESAVLFVGEPLDDRLRPVPPDSLDLLDLLLRRGEQTVDAPEMPREALRTDPPELRNVEAEEDPGERHAFGLGDRGDRVAGRDLAVAVELEQLIRGEPVEIR